MSDVILIADSGVDSFSATNRLRLNLDGHPANIQVARNFVENGGKVVLPIAGDESHSWESAPKLNGIYLYNYLTKQNINTSLINSFQKEQEKFKFLAAQKPKIVVISTTFMVDRPSVIELVAQVKDLCPEAVVIVGGPFVSLSWRINQAAIDNPLYATKETRHQFLFFNPEGDLADLYVISDRGDNLLCDVVQKILAGTEWRGQPNTAHIEQGKYFFAERLDDIAGREEIPIDWTKLPDEIFASGVVPMQASVGCPYRCNFCNFNKDPRLTYVKPLEPLITELKAVQSRGVKYVWFVDDNFRLGKRDIEDVCRRIIAEGISLQWMTLIRPEVLKDVDLELLKQAGCREVQMGLESADQQVLVNMNKQSDPVLNEDIIKRLLSSGINCACYFIFGYPGETEESMAKTVEFIQRLEDYEGSGFFYWSIYPFLLAPFSPVYDNREEYGLEGYLQQWQHQTMDSDNVKKALLKAFMTFDKSSPIYRGDNLDQISALSVQKGREFLTTRHRLEKLSVTNKLNNEIACQALSPLFSGTGI
jgi:anaerobic magnesium-protoporphyrin IX monomethyl ester cyclase